MREIINKYIKFAIDNWYDTWDVIIIWADLINFITIKQAIAIRDWKLEEFINNLLTNQ